MRTCRLVYCIATSSVARTFPGGRVAHPESQNEEENEKSLRKNKKKWSKFGGKMRKVETLAHPGLWGWLRPWLLPRKQYRNTSMVNVNRHSQCTGRMPLPVIIRLATVAWRLPHWPPVWGSFWVGQLLKKWVGKGKKGPILWGLPRPLWAPSPPLLIRIKWDY